MCDDKECFFNYRQETKEPIEYAGGQVLFTEGLGSLRLDAEKNNGLELINDVVLYQT
jgi:hypothetical protein